VLCTPAGTSTLKYWWGLRGKMILLAVV